MPGPLVVTAGGAPDSGSSPLTVYLSASATGGTPPYLFDWTFGDGTPDRAGPNQVHTYPAGTFAAVCHVLDSLGVALDSDPVAIEVSALIPNAAFTILAGQVCAADAPAPLAQILAGPRNETIPAGPGNEVIPSSAYYDRCLGEYVGTLVGPPPPPPPPTPFAVYVANEAVGQDSVTAIREGSFATDTVGVGARPNFLAVSPDGTRVYVANNGGTTVSVIDSVTLAVIATVTVGNGPYAPVVTPDGAYVFVSNQTDATVSAIRTSDHTVVATIHVGAFPAWLVVTPDSAKVYVSNEVGNTVSVIRVSTMSVVATVPGLNFPYFLTVSPDGSRVYVPNNGGTTVSVIDTSTDTVVATPTVGAGPYVALVTPDGTHAYVTNNTGNSVSVIRTADNTVVATIVVGHGPTFPAATPYGDYVFVPNSSDDTVSVIRTLTNAVVATVAAGSSPFVAVADQTYAYVTNNGGSTVTVISVASRSVVRIVPVGSGPLGIAGFLPAPAPTHFPVIASHATGSASAAAKVTVLLPTIPAGASVYIGVAFDHYPGSNVASVVDSAGNHYALQTDPGTVPIDMQVFKIDGAVGGTNVTVRATFTNPASAAAIAVALTNAVTPSPSFISNIGPVTSNPIDNRGSAVSTPADWNLVLTWVYLNNAHATYTEASEGTLLDQVLSPDNAVSVALCYETIFGTGIPVMAGLNSSPAPTVPNPGVITLAQIAGQVP